MAMTVPMLPATTHVGTVHLSAREVPRSRLFYERMLGMRALAHEDGSVSFAGGPGATDHTLLTLHPGAEAPVDPRRTGLFHLAILVPSRRDLAVVLMRLLRERWPLSGASDHLVSEALYLSDPEGNGIEIYRDRPREEWPRDEAGVLQMATLPLDLDALLAELGPDPLHGAFGPDGSDDPGLPAGTTIGHIHLQVASIDDAERFYAGVLGLDVTVRGYPGALFVSAGGYHHHIGLNTWHSRGAAAPEPGSAGLSVYELRVGSDDALAAVRGRVQAAGMPLSLDGAAAGTGGFVVRDPSGNAVLLRA
jgi:catechol 2,3-dioxygenase